MTGSAIHTFTDTAVLSVVAVEAPIVVRSSDFDDELAETYERVGLMPGMIQEVAGIEERRWWERGTSFADASAMAGAKALAEAGVDPSAIGLVIDTSVCRDHLEPSAAVDVHHQLALSSACLNFDLGNACLGFVNGMQLAATMIDSGQIDFALVVDGEGSRQPQEKTLQRLKRPETTKEDVFNNFATLTLGSGSAAMVLGRASDHPAGHSFVGGVSRAATEHNKLCIGTLDRMTTDSRGLLAAGVELSTNTWNDAKAVFDWSDLDAYVIHQVSRAHTAAITGALGIDDSRVPLTFPTLGNVGPASIPITLAHAAPNLVAGQRIACMGVGSGLNAAVIEIAW